MEVDELVDGIVYPLQTGRFLADRPAAGQRGTEVLLEVAVGAYGVDALVLAVARFRFFRVDDCRVDLNI